MRMGRMEIKILLVRRSVNWEGLLTIARKKDLSIGDAIRIQPHNNHNPSKQNEYCAGNHLRFPLRRDETDNS